MIAWIGESALGRAAFAREYHLQDPHLQELTLEGPPTSFMQMWVFALQDGRATQTEIGYFSRPTTKSGAQSNARLISESGNVQIDVRAASEYSWARAMATSTEP